MSCDEDRGQRHGERGGIGAPGNGERADDEDAEQEERETVMPGREHEQHRGEEIGAERA